MVIVIYDSKVTKIYLFSENNIATKKNPKVKFIIKNGLEVKPTS
jgi:hypothetical protein